jgi:hypothetical protein
MPKMPKAGLKIFGNTLMMSVLLLRGMNFWCSGVLSMVADGAS